MLDDKFSYTLHYSRGMEIVQNIKTSSIWNGEDCYTNDIFKKYGMEKCNPVDTPMDSGSKRHPACLTEPCTNLLLEVVAT